MDTPKRVSVSRHMLGVLIERDRLTCQYCGSRSARFYTVDHVVPVALGGKTALHNCVLACYPCNERKGCEVWIPRNLGAITARRMDWYVTVLWLVMTPPAIHALWTFYHPDIAYPLPVVLSARG